MACSRPPLPNKSTFIANKINGLNRGCKHSLETSCLSAVTCEIIAPSSRSISMPSPSLSVVIIAFNEERNLPHCLDSLEGIADEVLVVDSGSTDGPLPWLKSGGSGATHAFEGHIEQKNWAAAQATGEWLLSLDADEALSPELAASIRAWRADASAASVNGFRMNRLPRTAVSGCATAVGTRTPSFGFGRRDMPSGRVKTHTIAWTWRRAMKPVLWKAISCITRTIRSMITSVKLIISRTLPRWRIRGQRGWPARSFAPSKPDFSGSKCHLARRLAGRCHRLDHRPLECLCDG